MERELNIKTNIPHTNAFKKDNTKLVHFFLTSIDFVFKNSLRTSRFKNKFAKCFFFLPKLGCHHCSARPPLPLATGHKTSKIRNKERKKGINYSFTNTFVHTLLSVPEAVSPDGAVGYLSAFGRVTLRHPRQDPTALAESHLRRPTPFCT